MVRPVKQEVEMRKPVVLSLVSLAVLGLHGRANAQSNTWQGYAYFGVHQTPGAFGDVLSAGVGGEGFLYRGLAAGADLGYLFPRTNSPANGIGLLSVNPSYHFVNKDRTNRVVPFVTGGYGLAFRGGTANLVNFGGGATFWFRDGLGFRFEVRNYRDRSASFTTQLRFALAFR
jgi:hypothetical protein